MTRAWSAAELALVADQALSYEEVAELTGRSLGTVRSRASIIGAARQQGSASWDERDLAILRDMSLSYAEVVRRTGRSLAAVKLKAVKVGARRRPRWTEAELTVLADTSLSLQQVADLTGHPLGTVSSQALRRGIVRGARGGSGHYRWTDQHNKSWRGEDWPEVRELVLERDGYICQDCKSPDFSGFWLNVHHVIPYRLRPVNDPRWLITLCRGCHLQRPEHWWTEIPESVALLL